VDIKSTLRKPKVLTVAAAAIAATTTAVAIAMYASGSGDPAPPKTTAVQPVANVAPMDQAM
jgi:hypothetical protein